MGSRHIPIEVGYIVYTLHANASNYDHTQLLQNVIVELGSGGDAPNEHITWNPRPTIERGSANNTNWLARSTVMPELEELLDQLMEDGGDVPILWPSSKIPTKLVPGVMLNENLKTPMLVRRVSIDFIKTLIVLYSIVLAQKNTPVITKPSHNNPYKSNKQ